MEPFIITLSLSLYDLNNVEMDVKHQTTIIHHHHGGHGAGRDIYVFFPENRPWHFIYLYSWIAYNYAESVSGERMGTTLVNHLED